MDDLEGLRECFNLARGSPLALYITVALATMCSIGVYRWHEKHGGESGRVTVFLLCTFGWPLILVFGMLAGMVKAIDWAWLEWMTRHERRAARGAPLSADLTHLPLSSRAPPRSCPPAA